jgi:hypothetical protein
MKRPEKDTFPNVKELLTNHLGLAGEPAYHHIPQIHTNMYVYIHLIRIFEYMCICAYIYVYSKIYTIYHHCLWVYILQ